MLYSHAYFCKLHCESYIETHAHCDFQGASLQLFSWQPQTHTQTHALAWALWRQWRLQCYQQLHHSVSALHGFTSVLLLYLWVCVCVCYNRREGLGIVQRAWSASIKCHAHMLYVCVCVRERPTERISPSLGGRFPLPLAYFSQSLCIHTCRYRQQTAFSSL